MWITRAISTRRAVSITTLVPKQLVFTKSSGPAIDREVDGRVVAGHGVLERARVADVALDEAVPGVVVDVAHRRQVPGVGQGVVDGDLVVGVGEHPAHVVRADEPGAAGDELSHR